MGDGVSKRGPKRTATPILALSGSPRAKERAAVEPVVPPCTPEKPELLNAYAREAWDQIVPLLEEHGIVTRLDSHLLTVYCVTYARWRRAIESLGENGETYDGPQGKGEHPLARVAKGIQDQWRSLIGELGLSPAARSGLNIRTPASSGGAGLRAMRDAHGGA